ncbi:hypothetical protein [Flavobacterium sp. N1994]|uniref:hypothetical protein n=1 Tax=Flavobacterium sp. N1994 TaxID=2986827 RepID=UPI0022232E83|nr:hypothetical protein [Flavobacterium sp. N1994]
MKQTYFNAIALANKPFISWISVGSFTPAEFAASEYADDPLIIPEDEVPFPYNVFGVCPKKIVSGVLEDRTPAEMAVFEAEWIIENSLKLERTKKQGIDDNKFSYDGQYFPMDEVSRLFYLAIEKNRGNTKIKTMSNTLYSLLDGDIDDFLAAYYSRLLTISQHTI